MLAKERIMLVKMFKSKIHRATITGADLHYEGSCTIDFELMRAANILNYEAVWVWNINNGSRLMTYAIIGEPNSGIISLNGRAARLGHKGDLVIITTFSDMTVNEAKEFQPKVVIVNEQNKIKRIQNESGGTYE